MLTTLIRSCISFNINEDGLKFLADNTADSIFEAEQKVENDAGQPIVIGNHASQLAAQLCCLRDAAVVHHAFNERMAKSEEFGLLVARPVCRRFASLKRYPSVSLWQLVVLDRRWDGQSKDLLASRRVKSPPVTLTASCIAEYP